MRLAGATAVDRERRALLTTAGEVAYDSLLVAVGAKPREAVPGALTFRGAGDVPRVDAVLHDAALGRLERIVFALPGGACWPLPLYELALLARAELVDRGITSVEIVLVTPEERPLAVFGAATSEAIADLLEIRGIELRTHETPLAFVDGMLQVAPEGVVAADCVIALPRLEGPRLEGVAYDVQGFIPTDGHGRVTGEVDVYAAGDATTFPLKQGGIAAQQANAAAATIAEEAGAHVEPEPFRPVLRGLLLTGMVPRYLRAEAATGRSVADTEPLWWPPAKIVGKHLAPFLAEHLGLSDVFAEPPQGVHVDLTLEEAPRRRLTLETPLNCGVVSWPVGLALAASVVPRATNRGGSMSDHDVVEPLAGSQTRRTFLKRAGGAGIAILGGTLWRTGAAAAAARTAKNKTPIDHLVIACQENRSFDHYFGSAPQVRAAGLGFDSSYSNPGSDGKLHYPFEFTALSTPDPPHGWTRVHQQYDNGKMDGFWQASQDSIGDGDAAMGYYTAAELPFYYSLLDNSALNGNYFCSLLGPTWPNRFYFAAGTSGGITTNGVWGYGVFDYPIILDLLDEAGITWGVYNMNWDSVPYGNTDNVFVFWKNFAHDQRTLGSKGSFLNDARKGQLPNVSWLVSSFAHQKDEHPPADVSVGMGLQEELITALRESPIWDRSAYLLTYDEHGGFFDHVAPPQIDAFGLSVRVPLWAVSPFAKKGPMKTARPADHTSTIKLIEAMYGLPTLASRNHLFDTGTPTGGNYQAAAPGASAGPPAPPRDGRRDLSNLLDLFSF